MSAKSPIPRKGRCFILSDEEHEKAANLGGSAWLRKAIARDWDALPEASKWLISQQPGNLIDRVWKKMP